MAKKKGGFSKAKMKQLSKELDDEVKKFQQAVKKLTTDINTLQKGDGSISYWSGEMAYNWIKNALAHIDHDKVLLDHVDNCSDYLQNLVSGGSSL